MYIDRHGEFHTPQENDIVRPRSGGFIILIMNEKVLVSDGIHAIGVPELPGGGIEKGENALEAALRETLEETGFDIKEYKIIQEYKTHYKFYADDLNEYLDYDVAYFQIKIPSDKIYFEGRIKSPEGGHVWWMPLNEIKDNLPFRRTDKLSLEDMDLL